MRALYLLLSLWFTAGLIAVPHAENFTEGRDVTPFEKLKNGDYAWHPEISPVGPVVIIVSIPKQRLYVYRNGVRIGRSTVSTGRPGHPTPTGVFTILQKQVDHTSTIYRGASMPYMERLTWGGIALHAGQLPGFPDSHGCVRLPLDFAHKLYSVTTTGTTVIVTDGETAPGQSTNPGYLFTDKTGPVTGTAVSTDDYEWDPDESLTGPVSLIYSSKSSRLYVFRNGVEIGRAVVRGGEHLKLGIQAYMALDKKDAEGRRQWNSIGALTNAHAPELHDLIKRLTIPPAFLAAVRGIIVPGTILVVSDLPVNDDTQSDRDFRILSTEPLP